MKRTKERISGLRADGAPAAAAGAGACAHCGLGVPEGLLEAGAEAQFCCAGCRAAYSIIHSCGLERYYHLRDAASAAGGGDTRAPTARAHRYEEFDDPAFLAAFSRVVSTQGDASEDAELRRVELTLEGVHCAACVWLVERLPRLCPGVVESRLEFRRSAAHITWDPGLTTLSSVARTLDALGYRPHRTRDGGAKDVRRIDDRRALVRIGVAGACAGNVMLLASGLYAGMFDAMDPAFHALFRWLSMGISLVALAWPGAVFFRGAAASLRAGRASLDVPIALALGAGAAWGVVNTVRGTGEIYFDSLSVLVFALLVGRWMQRRQQRWAADSVELLYSLTPSIARLVEGGVAREVAVESLKAGDLVEINAGESAPVDGVVVDGASRIDQALLTGEPRPARVGAGDPIAAGSVNLSERLLVRAVATGADTRIARLMRLVEEASERRAPIVRLADRLAGVFVVAMLALAAATFGLWMVLDSPRAVDNAVALLVVTCPCALGLATPLIMSVALGRAARAGILIKGGDALESLAGRGEVHLDKTGTITRGRFGLVSWDGPESLKPLVGAVEARSSHPIARALAEAFISDDPPTVSSAVETTGAGMDAWVSERRVTVGSARFMERLGFVGGGWIERRVAELSEQGHTPVVIALDGRIQAVAGLGDAIREDARDSIERLRALGWRPAILSGDDSRVVRRVAGVIGVEPADSRGGVSPEGKAGLIAERVSAGARVVMVGDGVNDAAALASARVGIAVHGGAEASLAAADVYIARPGLSHVVDLVEGSRRVMRGIRFTMGVSIAYNAVAAGLAMAGALNPLIAAVLMPLSSLTVVALAVRVRTFRSTP